MLLLAAREMLQHRNAEIYRRAGSVPPLTKTLILLPRAWDNLSPRDLHQPNDRWVRARPPRTAPRRPRCRIYMYMYIYALYIYERERERGSITPAQPHRAGVIQVLPGHSSGRSHKRVLVIA